MRATKNGTFFEKNNEGTKLKTADLFEKKLMHASETENNILAL